MPNVTQRALVIVFDGVEELEALAVVDILRRAEIDVTIASAHGTLSVTGRNQITFSADTDLALVEDIAFDLVVLPGGPGVAKLEGNPLVAGILQRQARRGRAIGAICAAPRLLAQLGLLERHSATSHASVQTSLPRFRDAPVVEDGNIVTSQGAGTAIAFGLALARRLAGEAAAEAVARSIHFANSSPKNG